MKSTDAIFIMAKHYLLCAEWSENDGDWKDISFSQKAIDRTDRDCQDLFLNIQLCQVGGLDLNTVNLDSIDTLKQLGHDFWLTRNHHGSGFWDGKPNFWSDENGQTLTEICHRNFKQIDLYLGDDNLLYFE